MKGSDCIYLLSTISVMLNASDSGVVTYIPRFAGFLSEWV